MKPSANSDKFNLLDYVGRRELSREEESLFLLVKLAVFKNIPLNILVSDEFRESFKFGNLDDKVIGRKRIEKVIHALVILVEKKISALVKESKLVAIMHDGWKRWGVAYLCIYFSFTHPRLGVKQFLASCSPLHNVPEEEEDTYDDNGRPLNNHNVMGDEQQNAEVMRQTAEAHAAQIKDVLENFFGVDIVKQVLCQIVDNTNVNIKVAEILGIFQVGCR